MRRLTLRSRGLAPAGWLWPPFHFGSKPASLREPLNSNVSHHQELNDMRTLLPLLLALSTSGCAVTSTEVNVALARVGTRSAIRVEDVRLDKQLYMSAIALGGQASTYPLTPSPPLDIALMERLAAGQSRSEERRVGKEC